MQKKNINYKNIVHKEGLKNLHDLKKYNNDTWGQLIDTHLKKMNYIVCDSFEFPDEIVEQLKIFAKQIEKHISKDNTVAVLSAFPIFIHDYYGNKETRIRIKREVSIDNNLSRRQKLLSRFGTALYGVFSSLNKLFMSINSLIKAKKSTQK